MNIKHLNIEVTKRCNQQCFYCFNNSGIGFPASEFTPLQWLSILHGLKAGGLESVHLTGGEPFTYTGAVELLAGAQDLGLNTSILSNGLRVKELVRNFPDVFRRLVVAQISLDSMNEEIHNHRRGYPHAWQDAMDAIATLCESRVQVEVSCVVSNQTLEQLIALAHFCVGKGISLLLRPIVPVGRANGQHLGEQFRSQFTGSVRQLSEISQLSLVTDRFNYVPDISATTQGRHSGMATMFADGSLRANPCDELAISLVA